jgi:formate dehydrogenase
MSAPRTETRHTFCRICEALCGLEVTLEDGRIAAIRPDDRHVATRGFGCVKGLKQHELLGSPDRLRHPLKRVGDRHERVSWEQALAEIGAKVREITGRLSADSVAMYVGTAAGFGVLHPIFAQGFLTALGSKSMYSSATQDCANKFAVARHVYGFPFTQPFPDLDHVEALFVIGANPVVSKWSFLQVSNPGQRIKEIQARGGRVVVIDPRRTETAKLASEWVPIRAGSDVFFFLSFLHELFASGGVDRALAARHASGAAEVEKLVAAWPPERSEVVTRIPAAKLRELVAAYREADGAAFYCSTGVNMGGHGSLAFWLHECINALSGNLDRRGGALVGRGVIDFAKFGVKHGLLMRDDRSRVGDFGSTNDAFPGGLLADEILTPGEKQVRALFVTGGNPLITMPNANRLREAFRDLELLVVLDVLPTETASLAHYVLPCTSPLQRPDLPFVFPLMLGLQTKPYLQATRAVVPPEGEQRDEATIYLDLARACGRPLFGSRLAQRALEIAKALHSRRRPDEQPSIPQEALLSLLLRVTGQGSFARLLAHEHGRLRPAHAESDFLGRRVTTPDGKVQLAPAPLLEAAGRLDAAFEAERARGDQLKLISKRHVKTHNSWTHNHEDFVTGEGGTNYLYVHPDDAARIGLADGALADVTSATATVRVPVRILPDLMQGTVALPHGWGHQMATGLSVASRTRGVNVNVLAADGPERIERLSGMAHLTAIPVDVRPAAGPQDPTSWSGLPEGSTGGGTAQRLAKKNRLRTE